MEIDVNLHKPPNTIELKTISAGSYSHSHSNGQSHGGTGNGSSNNNNSHSFNNNHHQQQQARRLRSISPPPPPRTTSGSAVTPGCCGILSRLLCSSSKTATSSADYNTIPFNGTETLYGSGGGGGATTQQPYPLYANLLKKGQQHRRTPQEIYFESRGKSCKKLLKFNGNSNKILLYPEEGWARTASSSYWTITPCWWQPNRCRIEEFAGTQRRVTKAKMVPLEQKGSLLIVGHFRSKDSSTASSSNSGALSTYSTTSSTSSSGRSPSAAAAASSSAAAHSKDNDEFKLYLSSNISMEDYNMGYCLTGFVERRCQQTNTFQMTHFAVIKRQWPSLIHTQTPTSKASRVFCTSGGSSNGGSKRRDTSAKPT
ncbi:uncharacterized protein [Musca autumnalis]|uniref:uncharacterized protein n=1 Tax=Musca autumnalis TaxID=221902 RepID=UPI003CF1F370